MKLLFITGGSPWPTTLGVNQRTNVLLRALKQVADIDLIIYSGYAAKSYGEQDYLEKNYGLIKVLRPSPPAGKLFRNFQLFVGNTQSLYPEDQKNIHFITSLIESGKYDAVVCRYVKTAIISGIEQLHVPFFIDADDIDTQVFETHASKTKGISKLRALLTLRAVQRKCYPVLNDAQHVWIVSESDKKYVPHNRVSVLPNIPFSLSSDITSHVLGDPPHNYVTLIVASCLHTLNVNAIDQFVSNCWPLVLQAVPAAKVRLVGHGMTDSQKNRWETQNGVEAIGQVDDLEAEYRNATISTVPIWEGGGTKIKVLESLLYGRPVAPSTHAMRGLEILVGGKGGVTPASNPTELATKIIELLTNTNRCLTEALEGRKRVLNNFSFGNFCSSVKKGLSCIIPD